MSEQAIRCSVGLRSRTGLAIAVALSHGRSGLRVHERRELALFDPDLPETRAPHHAGLGLDAGAARRVVERAERAVRRVARERVRALVKELAKSGLEVERVGVVGSQADPARVHSPHMRAHAAEGRLFRVVLEEAAREAGLALVTLPEREAWEAAAAALRRPRAELEAEVQALGKQAGSPWRAHEKLAALAGWVALRGARGG